ncbi:NADH:flavin oxidoreductase/NADH oxidase [Bordetella genomosp. 10]|nr:NADH:flavin oxidoreductase/NADH oxidase [Bordetella genomosp. 10]
MMIIPAVDTNRDRKETRLFSPYTLRGVTFPNRAVLAPMQMYKAAQDGIATDWHFQHLARFAVGGFGTVMTEALMVDPRGRNTYGDLGLWTDDQIPGLRRIATFMKSMGVLPAAQLHHAGPKSSRQRPWEGLGPLGETEACRGEPPWQPVSATGSSTVQGWNVPHKLSVEEIGEIVEAYGRAAARAAEAGFEVLDIHSAHGYLLHSFLSPVNNDRDDAYGGDIHGRMRFPLEVAAAVRKNWPASKPLFFRISCVDWRPDIEPGLDGWTLEDSYVYAGALRKLGVDLIDCSSGGIRAENSGMNFVHKRQSIRKGHQVKYADAIRHRVGMPTMAVGAILDGAQAEAILAEDRADLVAVGRQALVDPHWALHASQELDADPKWQMWPPSYGWWLCNRAKIGVVE